MAAISIDFHDILLISSSRVVLDSGLYVFVCTIPVQISVSIYPAAVFSRESQEIRKGFKILKATATTPLCFEDSSADFLVN